MNKKLKNSKEVAIYCPRCKRGDKLIVRTNRVTKEQFLGCPNYPLCTYTQELTQELIMRLEEQPELF